MAAIAAGAPDAVVMLAVTAGEASDDIAPPLAGIAGTAAMLMPDVSTLEAVWRYCATIGGETKLFTVGSSGGAEDAWKPSAASDIAGCAIIALCTAVFGGTAGTAGSPLGAADGPTGVAAGAIDAVWTFPEVGPEAGRDAGPTAGTAALPTGALAAGAGWAPSGKAGAAAVGAGSAVGGAILAATCGAAAGASAVGGGSVALAMDALGAGALADGALADGAVADDPRSCWAAVGAAADAGGGAAAASVPPRNASAL